MKKIAIFTFSVLFLAACGGESSTQTETTEETPKMESHEGHDHGDTSMADAVPAVPAGANVFFVNIEEGAVLSSPVYVEFGIEGMEVEPAGEVKEGFGHHHVIIDGGTIPTGEAVPADETNIHYGGGQTGDTLTLTPGAHTLTLQFADGIHRSYGAQMATTIDVTVE